MERRAQATALWLPIAAGLLLAALPVLVELDPLVGIVHLGILLGLKAILRGPPWRAGALAAVPVVIGGLLRAGGGSGGRLLLLVLVSPLTIVISALVARAGSMLVEREPAAGDPADVAESSPTRRGMLDTKAQRGRFLVILGVLALAVTTGCRHGGRRQLTARLPSESPRSDKHLAGARHASSCPTRSAPCSAATARSSPEGRTDQTVKKSDKAIDATVEVRSGLQSRCIRVHLTGGCPQNSDLRRRLLTMRGRPS